MSVSVRVRVRVSVCLTLCVNMCEYVNMCECVWAGGRWPVAVSGGWWPVAGGRWLWPVAMAVEVDGGWWWWRLCVCVCVFDHGLYWGFWAWVSLLVAFVSCLFLCGGVCVRVRMCVCFACELVCCFFAVGVVKIWCSWFVCVGVQSCACVSVFKAVRVTAKTETDKDTEKR